MTQTFAYRRIERSLAEGIAAGDMKSGQKLPSLRSMSSRFGVSLNTVLKAYEELERQGVIESRPRSGFFVTDSTAPPMVQPPPSAVLSPESVSRSQLIREVMSAMGSGDLLSMGLSVPDASLLPGRALGRLLSDVLRDYGHRALDYTPVEGAPELRRHVALLAQEAGADLRPDQVMITSGAVEGLSIALRSVTRPGDAVAIPTPTYYCMLELMETLGLRVVELPSCPSCGLDPAELARALARFNVAAVALIPNFNNPDGSLMPDHIKAEVGKLAAAHGVPIIEDNVYGELAHDGPKPKLLRALAPPQAEVLTVSSFSKTLAPSFRVGWLAPGFRRDTALKLKATTNVCTPAPLQLTVAEFIRRGGYVKQVENLRGVLARQSRTLRGAIGRHFPAGTAVTEPQGGMHLWVKLPQSPSGPIDAVAYFLAARQAGIGVCPGTIFSPSDRFGDCVRLSCGAVWSDKMEEAVATLGGLAKSMADGER